MLTRDMTFSDVERLQAAVGDTPATFVMDEDAFRGFYDRTSRSVWAYLARISGDRTAADDLLQETFYRFLRSSTPYESEAHRRNALFRIATNLVYDRHRRRRTEPAIASHEPDLAPSADDVAGQVQRRTDLSRAMNAMKPRERAMLWLAYAEGSSHREIADTLGVKAGSVKLMLFRARRRLATLMGGARAGGGQ